MAVQSAQEALYHQMTSTINSAPGRTDDKKLHTKPMIGQQPVG